MSGELWIQITVPIALVIMMISMGTELKLADFRRIIELPKPILVGLTGQLLWLPILGIAFAKFSGLNRDLALGVVIITACPGGAPSNIFTYLGRGNVALSVSLTAISSVVTIVSIPFWIRIGSDILFGESSTTELPVLRTMAQLLGVALIPVAIGMWIRSRNPEAAKRWRPRLRRAVAILMVVVTTLIVASLWEEVVRDFSVAVPSSLLLVVLAIASAFAIGMFSRLDRRDAFTISIEVGLQNGALATMIVVNLLERPELLIFPGAYAMLAFFPIGAWVGAWRFHDRARS